MMNDRLLELLAEADDEDTIYSEVPEAPVHGHYDEQILLQRKDFMELCDEVEAEYGTKMSYMKGVWL